MDFRPDLDESESVSAFVAESLNDKMAEHRGFIVYSREL
jgi:hypothetical protein